jgi:hypothetical protein
VAKGRKFGVNCLIQGQKDSELLNFVTDLHHLSESALNSSSF